MLNFMIVHPNFHLITNRHDDAANAYAAFVSAFV